MKVSQGSVRWLSKSNKPYILFPPLPWDNVPRPCSVDLPVQGQLPGSGGSGGTAGASSGASGASGGTGLGAGLGHTRGEGGSAGVDPGIIWKIWTKVGKY